MIGIPAHGAFGVFDELFLIFAIAIFVILLVAPSVITTLRKRNADRTSSEGEATHAQTTTSDAANPGKSAKQSQASDRFRLD
jgi:hypothetical protein